MKAFVAVRPPRTPMDSAKFTRATGITPRHWKEAVEEHFSGWKV
jgi:dTDP-4-dehydrorhamnose reductase